MPVDRDQIRRDAPHYVESMSLVNVDPHGKHTNDCPGCIIEALLAELEQAERDIDGPSGYREQLIAARKGEQIEHGMRKAAEARLAKMQQTLDTSEASYRIERDLARESQRRLAKVPALAEAVRAIQAVAVMTQNRHAKDHRLDWLREIESRARAALAAWENE